MHWRDSSAVGPLKILSEQEMGEDDAGGKEVGAFVGDFEIGLFGAHVIGLAGDHFAFVVLKKSARLGDAEIGQFHIALEGDHDVFETDIAMDNAEGLAVLVGFGMGVGESAGDAAGDEDGKFAGQGAFLVGQLLGELFQVDAADQFHGDEEHAARLAQMVGLDDVGMDQVRDEFGFADEIVDELFLVGVILADDLDGDALDEVARAVLLGLIDDAHAAFKNLADDLVAEIAFDGEQSHSHGCCENGV